MKRNKAIAQPDQALHFKIGKRTVDQDNAILVGFENFLNAANSFALRSVLLTLTAKRMSASGRADAIDAQAAAPSQCHCHPQEMRPAPRSP